MKPVGDFPDYYENEFLPRLTKEISEAPKKIEQVAVQKTNPRPAGDRSQ